jgi:lipopolysaccharide/colanic/teichoic acid biosynthesis glycosyltransferase
VHNYVGRLDSSSAAPEGAHADVALGGLRKRTFDIVVAGILLVVMAPLLLVTAGLIRLMIGRSAIVIKQWIGFGGKVYDGYQFCTVFESCEDRSSALQRNDRAWAASLGGALQASGLDKLPLLLNVLRGDMSLVGPRPIVVGAHSHHPSRRPVYYTARPGLIGPWRYSRSLNPRKPATQKTLDRYYVRYWSMWFDLMLLIEVIFRGA